ncbi:MAG: DUF6994 family protein [Nocardioidaceae bacterium]
MRAGGEAGDVAGLDQQPSGSGWPDAGKVQQSGADRGEEFGEFPLGDTIERYADFFALFGDFRGYGEFFHLQDLVTDDYQGVRFFMPFEHFGASALPRDVEEYRTFRTNSIEFITARNRRIAALRL